jgi:hypothetical protein
MRAQTRVILGAIVILIVVVAAIVLTTRSTAPVPQHQNRVAMPGMNAHPVSLWLDPAPAEAGVNQITIQVADPTGMPLPAEDVLLYIYPATAFPDQVIETQYTSDAPIQDFLGTGHGFTASVDFPQPGDWFVEVHFELYGMSRSTIFEIEVE